MAETGIMGSSGDFRTNDHNTGGGSGGGGFGKVADIFVASAARKQRISHEQFMAAASHANIKEQGRQDRKTVRAEGKVNMALENIRGQNDLNRVNAEGKQSRATMRTSSSLRRKDTEHAVQNGVSRISGNYQTGEHEIIIGAKNTRGSATRSAASPSTRATGGQTYNARNPHPKNPWDKGTQRKEFTDYNKGTPAQRAQSSRRFKALGGK